MNAVAYFFGRILGLFQFLALFVGRRDEDLAQPDAVLPNELRFVLLIIIPHVLLLDHKPGRDLLLKHGIRHHIAAHLIHQVFDRHAETLGRPNLEFLDRLQVVLLHHRVPLP